MLSELQIGPLLCLLPVTVNLEPGTCERLRFAFLLFPWSHTVKYPVASPRFKPGGQQEKPSACFRVMQVLGLFRQDSGLLKIGGMNRGHGIFSSDLRFCKDGHEMSQVRAASGTLPCGPKRGPADRTAIDGFGAHYFPSTKNNSSFSSRHVSSNRSESFASSAASICS